jgi:hypothetical protein
MIHLVQPHQTNIDHLHTQCSWVWDTLLGIVNRGMIAFISFCRTFSTHPNAQSSNTTRAPLVSVGRVCKIEMIQYARADLTVSGGCSGLQW